MPTIRNCFSFINTEVVKYPKVVNQYSFDKEKSKLFPIGSKNIVAFINAPARETLVSSKIQRYIAGDITALGGGTAKGIYTDISGIPTDYNTMQSVLSRANRFVKSQNADSIASVFKNLVKSKLETNIKEVPASASEE